MKVTFKIKRGVHTLILFNNSIMSSNGQS